MSGNSNAILELGQNDYELFVVQTRYNQLRLNGLKKWQRDEPVCLVQHHRLRFKTVQIIYPLQIRSHACIKYLILPSTNTGHTTATIAVDISNRLETVSGDTDGKK